MARNPGNRSRRISELIREALSRILIENVQNPETGLLTVTRVEMSSDLLTARIHIRSIGQLISGPDIAEILDARKDHIRRRLASRLNLKYNPQLVFAWDPSPELEEKIDTIMAAEKIDDD
jgi:ribosome-binding factor A